MKIKAGVRYLLFLQLIVLIFTVHGQDSDLRPVSTKYAITNATIVQSPGKVIQNGSIVFENGVIKNVGANISIPSDAWIIKGDSMFVYPGFISGLSNIGVPAPKEDRERIDSKLKANPPYEKAGITPQLDVVTQLAKGDKSIDDFRKLGFTAALTAPHSGMMSGRSAIILLSDSEPEAIVLKSNYSLYSQLSGARGMYPNTIIGVMAKYRDMYGKAKQALAYQGRYASSGAGMERPVRDLTIESLYPIVRKELPVTYNAQGVKDILRVLTLQKEIGFNLQLAEIKQGWDVIGEIKKSGASVLLSLDLPEMKKEKEKKEDDSEEEKEEIQKTPGEIEKEKLEMRKREMLNLYYSQPSKFAQANVSFGFSTLGVKSKDFKGVLTSMIENGLSEEQTLAALTTSPAHILGVSEVMGTIEKGKLANLLVTDKPYFSEKSNVKYVFVDGKMTEYEVKKEKKKKSGGEPVDPRGTWNFTYGAEGQSWSGVLTIDGEEGSYDGSLYLSFNDSTNDLTSVEVDGSTITATAKVSGGGTEVEVSISADIDGESMTGSLTAGQFGSYELEGSKEPNN